MDGSQSAPTTIPCRLCGGPSTLVFRKLVLGHHSVGYYRCGSCRSLQTEMPHWLDEAYAIPGVHIDVGCASRTLKNWAGLSTLLGRLKLPKEALAFDFGAGSGLLGRLMRDIGYNFHSHDKYARPSFTSYNNFDELPATKPQLITAFEVFEHLPEPKTDLEQLLGLRAPLIVFTTWFYSDQGEDWIYLVAECGQHVFFYSEQAMRELACTNGYELRSSAFFHILSRPEAFDKDQRRVLEEFPVHGATWASAGTADLLASIWLGNSYIDADFEVARQRFSTELEASTRHRHRP